MKRSLRLARLFCLILVVAGILAFLYPKQNDTAAMSFTAHRDSPTVVVDAGHGGADGGAVSISGAEESGINLSIAKKLELILAFYGTNVVMTRESATIDYSEKADTIREKKNEDQKRRLSLIKSIDNAFLISIHQNNYPGGGPFGAQAFYAPTRGSKEFAEALQKLLVDTLNKENRRPAVKIPGSVLLLNHISCPAVLIECGFLSNAAEEKLLKTDTYQTKIAAVIAAGYLLNKDTQNNGSGGTNED